MPTIEVRTFLAEPDEISQVTSCDIVLAKVTSEESEVEISSCETSKLALVGSCDETNRQRQRCGLFLPKWMGWHGWHCHVKRLSDV